MTPARINWRARLAEWRACLAERGRLSPGGQRELDRLTRHEQRQKKKEKKLASAAAAA